MDLNARFVPRSRDVASEDFEGEFVVLDLESGKYFSLLGAAAIVWRGLMAGHSIESLSAQLPADDARRAGVAGLVGSLVEHGLIVATSAAPAGEPPVGVAAELAAASGPFGVEMFDDLADLLVADPIHDVDQETGWPVLPPTRD